MQLFFLWCKVMKRQGGTNMNINKLSKISLFTVGVMAAAVKGAVPVHATTNALLAAPVSLASDSTSAVEMNDVKKSKALSGNTVSEAGFVELNGKTYYLDGFGNKKVGPTEIDGHFYYFNALGEMETGFVQVDGKTYFYDPENGQLQTGEASLDGEEYVLQNNGEFLTGWQETKEGKTYYEEDGSQVVNTTETIDGTLYSFDDNGVMETNVTKDGYDFNAQGVGSRSVSAYQRIADAALAQVGVYQDCTMLVTNALKAVGINFHGWPAEYLSLGPVTNNPVPGDIIVYSGHVAIYIGDGKAVHGGYLGNQTVVWTVETGQPILGFVHPILP